MVRFWREPFVDGRLLTSSFFFFCLLTKPKESNLVFSYKGTNPIQEDSTLMT